MKSNEVWVPVLGWEANYEVSNLGNVRSKRTGNLLRPSDCGYGYLGVMLQAFWGTPNAKKKSRKVHRIVLESFTGTTKPGMHVAHNNGDKQDNRLENLRWATIEENFADRKKHGTNEGRKGEPRDKLSKDDVRAICELVKQGQSSRAIARKFDIHVTNVDHIRNARTWKSITVPYFKGKD